MDITLLEQFLADKILPELEQGRPGWDKPHTLLVVSKLKEILISIPELKLDKEVLLIAAYAHDWGYAGLFNHNVPLTLTDVKNVKETHAVMSESKLSELFKSESDFFDFLSSERKLRALHLVRVHDSLKELKDIDELVLMEADTLGGLDVAEIKSVFDYDSNVKFMGFVRTLRVPLFITEYGKNEVERLFIKRDNHYRNLYPHEYAKM